MASVWRGKEWYKWKTVCSGSEVPLGSCTVWGKYSLVGCVCKFKGTLANAGFCVCSLVVPSDYSLLRLSTTYYLLKAEDPKVILSLKQVQPPSVHINVSFNCWSPQNFWLRARQLAWFVKHLPHPIEDLSLDLSAYNPSTGKWEVKIEDPWKLIGT